MIAVFYDRKNRQFVTSEQLMQTNVVEHLVGIDSEEFSPGSSLKSVVEKYGEEVTYIQEKVIGCLAYKSQNCPSYCNWDLFCNESDLIFVRLEK